MVEDIEKIKRGIKINRILLIIVIVLLTAILAIGVTGGVYAAKIYTQYYPTLETLKKMDFKGLYDKVNSIDIEGLYEKINSLDIEGIYNKVNELDIESIVDEVKSLDKCLKKITESIDSINNTFGTFKGFFGN